MEDKTRQEKSMCFRVTFLLHILGVLQSGVRHRTHDFCFLKHEYLIYNKKKQQLPGSYTLMYIVSRSALFKS
jgi:hypothetical protein